MTSDGGKQTVLPTDSASEGAKTPNPYQYISHEDLELQRNAYMEKWKRGKIHTSLRFVLGLRELMTSSVSEHVAMCKWNGLW